MFEAFDKPYVDPVQLPLLKSLCPLVAILAVYLLFVLKLGGMMMAGREPFQLRGVLKVYNIGQVLFNAVMVTWAIHLLFVSAAYDMHCINVLPLDHPLKTSERMLSYIYHLNKVLDLLDTVFFVLRKKQRQITFLHVFHHVFMCMTTHLIIRFYGHGGHITFTSLLNTMVHTVMYVYYYASSQSQKVQESLWWKKYLTLAQLVQFLIMFLHSAYIYVQPNCQASRGVIYTVSAASLFMFVMFTQFYIKNYTRSKQVKSKGEKYTE